MEDQNYIHHIDYETGQIYHEHRRIAEEKLGRKLLQSEVVHHKDGNIRNNDPENLEVFVRITHAKMHGFSCPRGSGGIWHRKVCQEDSTKAWCATCKTFLSKEEFNKNRSRWNGVQAVCRKCFKSRYIKKQ